jgi:hypothetical protein
MACALSLIFRHSDPLGSLHRSMRAEGRCLQQETVFEIVGGCCIHCLPVTNRCLQLQDDRASVALAPGKASDHETRPCMHGTETINHSPLRARSQRHDLIRCTYTCRRCDGPGIGIPAVMSSLCR